MTEIQGRSMELLFISLKLHNLTNLIILDIVKEIASSKIMLLEFTKIVIYVLS